MIPSAIFAWVNRDMPQFGSIHDDSIYFVGGKSWATGHGHRIISLPGQPFQTKYPPLYPMFLSAVWLISPKFPANLKLATLLSWLWMPPLLWLARILYRHYGFPDRWAWCLLGVIALNPYVHLFSASLLSEVPFTVMLLGVLLLAPRYSLAAGALAGVAYLTRTAAIPLIVALPAAYALKRQWRSAALFIGSMLPFIAGWTAWTRTHISESASDPYLMYYVDYFRYEIFNVNASNFMEVFGHNFQELLVSLSAAVIPAAFSRWMQLLAYVIAIATVVGLYRLARDREAVRPYAFYATVLSVMLVTWHYPPNGRFLFPLFPVLLAGFSYQVTKTIEVIRVGYADRKQRTAAIAFASVLVLLSICVVWSNYAIVFEVLPITGTLQRSMRADDLTCAARIGSELGSSSKLLAPTDPTLYLLAARESMRMTVAPKYFYADGHDGMLRAYSGLPGMARAHGMTHVYVNRRFDWDLPDDQRAVFFKSLAENPELRARFQCGDVTVYEIR